MKNHPLSVVWLLALLFVLQACKDPEKEEGNLTIQLQPFVGAQPLSFSNTTYTNGNQEFYLSKLKFYVSHVKLVKADNSEVEVEDVAFFNYSDNAWKSFTVKADPGTYKGIKFSVGLDPAQNATNPLNLSSSDPLGPQDDMHWDWLKYRFIVIEGTADTLGNNFAGGVHGLVYHVGRDTCYRNTSLSGTEFTVNNEGEKTINLKLDLLNIFQGSNSINMFTESGTQSENSDLNIAIKFADRFAQSFSYSE
jgi:hypothetical protein